MADETKIKSQLVEMRDELRLRLERIGAHQQRKEQPLDPDFEEQAVEQQNDEVVTALDDVSQTILVRVERALTKIESGEYGICGICGGEINSDRLEAIPYADTCIECAERSEGC